METEKELLDYLSKHKISDVGDEENFVSKIGLDIRPWFIENVNVLIKLGYIWSIASGKKWKSVPNIESVSTVIVKEEFYDGDHSQLIISVDNWDFETIRINTKELVDITETTKRIIEQIRTKKHTVIERLMSDLGKEVDALDEIDEKIKEWGLEQ